MFSPISATDPNSTIWWALLCLLCPGPLGVLVGFVFATAIHKRWIKVNLDTSNMPKLRRHRND
jgi:hypothetical protein